MERKQKKSANGPRLYATEAYLYQTGRLIPMNAVAADLLEAKTLADIETIHRKYGIYLHHDNPYGTFYGHGLHFSEYETIRRTAIIDSSYASWLLVRMRTLSACLQVYAVCLPIARGTSPNTDVTNLFNVLFYTHKAHQEMTAEAIYNYGWIPRQDIREQHTNRLLKEISTFPLTALFEAFQDEEGHLLQRLYGYTFKQMRRRGDLSPPQSQYHYWENPAAYTEARTRLWGYTSKHRTDGDEFILNWDAQGLACSYLRILDRYVESLLSHVKIRLDSVYGKAGLVGNQLHYALNLWLFTQIQTRTDYRVCKMCGRLFIAGAQKGKKYCDLHKKHEINYYNKTIGRLEKSCSAAELPQPQ